MDGACHGGRRRESPDVAMRAMSTESDANQAQEGSGANPQGFVRDREAGRTWREIRPAEGYIPHHSIMARNIPPI